MAPKDTSGPPTNPFHQSSSFSNRTQRMQDLVDCRASRQRKAPAQYLQDRWRPGAVSEPDDDADADAAPAASSSSRLYLDLSFQERRDRLQRLVEKRARRRRLFRRRQEQERHQQRRERRRRRRQRRLEKNDEIVEWRDTFELGVRPPGIEKQFPKRSRVPGRYENRWLVPARTSKTMLERA